MKCLKQLPSRQLCLTICFLRFAIEYGFVLISKNDKGSITNKNIKIGTLYHFHNNKTEILKNYAQPI